MWDVQNTPEEVIVEEESQEDSKPESQHSNGSNLDGLVDTHGSTTEGTSSRCSDIIKVLLCFINTHFMFKKHCSAWSDLKQSFGFGPI